MDGKTVRDTIHDSYVSICSDILLRGPSPVYGGTDSKLPIRGTQLFSLI